MDLKNIDFKNINLDEIKSKILAIDKKILIKLSKYNQHSILDVPTIGIKTLKNFSAIIIFEFNFILIRKYYILKVINCNLLKFFSK